MKPRGLYFLLIGLVLSAIIVTLPLEGRAAEADRVVIEKTIRDSIGWALSKDRPLLESLLSHDADFFIFHPDSKSTVVGWESFVELFDIWMDPRFKATEFDVRDLRINASRSGDVAWFSTILDDCGEWDGKPSCWNDTRWTGVLEKRDGKWIIVQMHFSFASDQEQVETSTAAKAQPSFQIEAWEKRINKRQPPVEVLDAIGVAPGMVIGEIGAGTGRMTLWLAERTGVSGKIYANDINREYLEKLQERCDRDGFENVEIVLGEIEDPKLPVGVLDMAFMINVYHHLENPVSLVKNIRSSLKPNGFLAIVECDPEKTDWGEKEGCNGMGEMVTEMKEAGFKLHRIETFLNEDNIYIARPN